MTQRNNEINLKGHSDQRLVRLAEARGGETRQQMVKVLIALTPLLPHASNRDAHGDCFHLQIHEKFRKK